MKINDILDEALKPSPVVQPGATPSPIPGKIKQIGKALGTVPGAVRKLIPSVGIPGKDPDTGQSTLRLSANDPRVKAQLQKYQEYQKHREAGIATGVAASGLRDARDDLPNDATQFSFFNPNDKSSKVVIRQDGYYLTKLPAELRGYNIKREPGTNLYRVNDPNRIAQINKWYDEAQAGRIVMATEPVTRL